MPLFNIHFAITYVARQLAKKRNQMNFTKNLGMLVLAIYLIIIGITGVFGVSLGGASILLPILALIAGILILIGK